jgi:hypothetical protein
MEGVADNPPIHKIQLDPKPLPRLATRIPWCMNSFGFTEIQMVTVADVILAVEVDLHQVDVVDVAEEILGEEGGH